MREHLEILESIPKELREPVVRLVESVENRLRSEFSVTRLDFERLEHAVTELAQAQKRTEKRVEELPQAQKRTEERLNRLETVVEELAKAQKRTEERVEELAKAQKRTEERIEELVKAQQSMERQLGRFERTFESKIGALGARWGLSAEAAFRSTMRGILEDMGFQVRRYLKFDKEGKVFDHPDQVELDVVIQDGMLILIEIKSSISRADITIFQRKIRFYEEQEGRTADRRLIISPFVEPPAMERATNLGMEVFTDINSVQ